MRASAVTQKGNLTANRHLQQRQKMEPTVELQTTRLFRGHKYTLTLTVPRMWKSLHVVTDDDLIRCGLRAVCARADFRTSRELSCEHCGSVFRVSDPMVRRSDSKATVLTFGITPQCSSSRIHLKCSTLLRLELPGDGGFAFSQPFTILARERKSVERTFPTGTPNPALSRHTPTLPSSILAPIAFFESPKSAATSIPVATAMPGSPEQEGPSAGVQLPPLVFPSVLMLPETPRLPRLLADPPMTKQNFVLVNVFVPFVSQFQENGMLSVSSSWVMHVEKLRAKCFSACPNSFLRATDSQSAGSEFPGMLVVVFCTSVFDEMQLFRSISAAWSAEVLSSGTARPTGVFSSW